MRAHLRRRGVGYVGIGKGWCGGSEAHKGQDGWTHRGRMVRRSIQKLLCRARGRNGVTTTEEAFGAKYAEKGAVDDEEGGSAPERPS